MKLFKRIFASYYFIFLKYKSVTKGNENLQALMFVSIWPLLVTAVLIRILANHGVIPNPNYPKKFAIVVGLGLLLVNYIYFLFDAERKKRILGEFLELKESTKNNWRAISILVILIPLFDIFLTSNYK